MKRTLVGFIAALFPLVSPADAGVEPAPVTPSPELRDNFAGGAREFESLSGAFFFFDTTKNNRPSIDFALQSFRLGVMLNDPWEVGLLSGNFELMGEAFGGGIFEGPGNVLFGATLVFRYNFVHRQSRAPLIPYVQIGAGGVYTDIDEKESRGLISLPVEFNLQAGIGTRIMLNDRWSLIIEGDYRHISNAEIKKPNFGIDSLGGNLGFGFSF